MPEIKSPGNLAHLLELLQTVDGVLACGACLGNHMVVYRHRPDYPLSRDQAKLVWKSIKETFHTLHVHDMPADHLQWSFGEFNLHAVYRNAVAVGIMVEKSISDDSFHRVETALASFSAAEPART